MPTESSSSSEVTDRLDIIVRLLAYLVAAEHDNLQDRAVALTSLGLTPKEIARVCNTTPNTVSVRLVEAKRKIARKRVATGRKHRR